MEFGNNILTNLDWRCLGLAAKSEDNRCNITIQDVNDCGYYENVDGDSSKLVKGCNVAPDLRIFGRCWPIVYKKVFDINYTNAFGKTACGNLEFRMNVDSWPIYTDTISLPVSASYSIRHNLAGVDFCEIGKQGVVDGEIQFTDSGTYYSSTSGYRGMSYDLHVRIWTYEDHVLGKDSIKETSVTVKHNGIVQSNGSFITNPVTTTISFNYVVEGVELAPYIEIWCDNIKMIANSSTSGAMGVWEE
jgi:hypothetical protein